MFALLKRENFIYLALILFFGILASRTLVFQDGYFNMHDDLQMMRQLQLEKCFLDGQIPCRWVPDMGYGFGFPLFNFYPPLPYLVGQLFRLAGFTFVWTVKLTFAASIVVSGIAMYFFAKEFVGKKGALLASVFYVWAPYHAVDVYVRGAMNESWALVWFPLILLACYKIIQNTRFSFKWFLAFSLSYAGLFLSHNLMVLIFTPVVGAWILLHLIISKNYKSIIYLGLSSLYSLGLVAFFTLPAVVENKYTHLSTQLIGYYDYTAHFASIGQLLFSRFWGYGPSVWLTEDGMSFQVGHFHWILSIVAVLLLVFYLFKSLKGKPKKAKLTDFLASKKTALSGLLLFAAGWLAVFMVHPRSIAVWDMFGQLRLVQFPWRFLAVVIFCFSFVVGTIPWIIDNWLDKKHFLVKLFARVNENLWIGILIVLLVVLNWNYFLPENGRMGELTDEQKFTGRAWDLQQTAGIYDYLPTTAVMAPREPMRQLAEVMEGEAEVFEPVQGTDWAEFGVRVDSAEAVIRLGILDFPGWQVSVDGQVVEHYVAETEEWGRMYVNVPSGEHAVRAEFTDTPVRQTANIISAVSWAFLVFVASHYCLHTKGNRKGGGKKYGTKRK